MKEIKFRAWDLGRGKMVLNPSIAFMQGWMGIDKTCCVNCLFDNGDQLGWMQYTGLKDKNGKEIYEGDILTLVVNIPDGYDPMQDYEMNHNEVLKYKVEIDEDIIRIKLIPLTDEDNPFGTDDYAWYLTDSDEEHEIEIIGNIYEDRHLIDNNS